MGESVVVSGTRYCDLCKPEQVVATVDGKTNFGPWANMCGKHFKAHGIGLGTGKGQQLIYK